MADGTDEEFINPCLHLDVFKHIRSAQGLYGLKHADYKRYRQHCGIRLSKLRCLLRFHHGRHRYQKKELKLTSMTDARWLEMMLLDAERAWAFGHEIKAQIEQESFVHTNKRRHMLRRFAKATKHAEALLEAANSVADDVTVLECSAYADVLRATELFEKDMDQEVAAQRLLRGRASLSVIGRVKSMPSAPAAKAKITELDAMLRLILHRLSQSEGRDMSADDVPPLHDDSAPKRDATLQKLEASVAGDDTAASASQQVSTFAWHGVSVPVSQPSVQEHIAKAMDAQAAEAQGSFDADRLEECAQAQAAVQARLLAALQAARSALDSSDEDVGTSGGSEGELGALLHAAILEAAIAKGTSEALIINAKFRRNTVKAMSNASGRERGARPEDAVRHYDALHKTAHELYVAAQSEQLAPAAIQRLMTVSGTLTALYGACRGYFLSQRRLARQEDGSLELAAGMFSEAVTRLEQVESSRAELSAVQVALLDSVLADARAYRVVALAACASEAAAAQGHLAGKMQGLGLHDEKRSPGTSGDDLDVWGSLVKMPGCKSHLFRLTSLLQTVAMRPVTLDTALAYIEEPDISHRMPARAENAEQPASMVQGLKSLFGFR